MISRVLLNKKAIRRVLGNDKDTSHLVPSWQDLEVLECINSALSPLREFTDVLSASTYVTISAFKPILHHLSTVELACEDGDLPLTCQLKRDILQCLKSKYVADDLKLFMDVTSYLDPRYMTDFLTTDKSDRNEATPSELDLVREKLLGEVVFLSNVEVEDFASNTEPSAKKMSLGALTSLKKTDRMPISAAMSPRDHLSAEMERYTKHPVIDGDENPLKWWQQNESDFHCLVNWQRNI